jgi:hypothetical protein
MAWTHCADLAKISKSSDGAREKLCNAYALSDDEKRGFSFKVVISVMPMPKHFLRLEP